METVFELSDINFDQEVKRSTIPVVVFFYSGQCGFCIQQKPIVNELVKEKSSKVTFVKLDITKSQRKANEYGIKSVPHFVIFNDGKQIASFGGFHHKFQLNDRLIAAGIK